MTSEPNAMDVVCGRGNKVNHHPGNRAFRRMIQARTELYRSLDNTQRPLLVKSVVLAVQSRGSQFMTKNKETGQWRPVSHEEALSKTKQSFRRSVTNNLPSHSVQAIATSASSVSRQSAVSRPSPKAPPQNDAAKAPPPHQQQQQQQLHFGCNEEEVAEANAAQATPIERLDGLAGDVHHQLGVYSEPSSQSSAEPDDDRKVRAPIQRDAAAAAAALQVEPEFHHGLDRLHISGPTTHEYNHQHTTENATNGLPSDQTHGLGHVNEAGLRDAAVANGYEIQQQQQQQQQNVCIRSRTTFSAAIRQETSNNEGAGRLPRWNQNMKISDETSQDSGLPRMHRDAHEFFDIDTVFDSDEDILFDYN